METVQRKRSRRSREDQRDRSIRQRLPEPSYQLVDDLPRPGEPGEYPPEFGVTAPARPWSSAVTEPPPPCTEEEAESSEYSDHSASANGVGLFEEPQHSVPERGFRTTITSSEAEGHFSARTALDGAAQRRPSRIALAPGAGIALVLLVVGLASFAVIQMMGAEDGVAVSEQGQSVSAADDAGVTLTTPISTAPEAIAAAVAPAPTLDPVVVAVVGRVARSGLVTLPGGSRVEDALLAAGGTVDGADREGLNIARVLNDGEQILVGLVPKDGQPELRSNIVGPGERTMRDREKAGASAVQERIDLNVADASELESLRGVGAATSAAILAWRAENGRFSSIDQLTEVSGIGPAKLAAIRLHVTV